MRTISLALMALMMFAVSTFAEVHNGDTWTSSSTGDITFSVSQNSIANDCDVSCEGQGSSSSTVTGTLGSNSSASNPSCEDSPSMSVDHDGDGTTPDKQVRVKNGKGQYKDDNGNWKAMKRKKKPRRSPGDKPPQGNGGTEVADSSSSAFEVKDKHLAPAPTSPPGYAGSIPAEDVTSLPMEVHESDSGLSASP